MDRLEDCAIAHVFNDFFVLFNSFIHLFNHLSIFFFYNASVLFVFFRRVWLWCRLNWKMSLTICWLEKYPPYGLLNLILLSNHLEAISLISWRGTLISFLYNWVFFFQKNLPHPHFPCEGWRIFTWAVFDFENSFIVFIYGIYWIARWCGLDIQGHRPSWDIILCIRLTGIFHKK